MKIILFLLLAPLCMVAARMECPGVPSLTAEAACRLACGTKLMHDICMDTLREGGVGSPGPSHGNEVTVYALIAARRAADSYAGTGVAAVALLRNASLSDDEREAYVGCLHDYASAENSIRRVADGFLANCYFRGVGGEYRSGMTALESCRDRLLAPWLSVSPLYAMVMVDRNRGLLAYLLGRLLGI